jgi:GNAT superfamily N-acetyltransferase
MCEMLKRLSKSAKDEISLLADDTNGEMLRLAERFGFETALRYPLWSWKKVELDRSTLDFNWSRKVKRQEISDLYFRAGSSLFKNPVLLQNSFNKANVRLAVRQYGELLAIAKGSYDGSNTVIITGFLVDRLYRRQGIGSLMYRAIKDKYSKDTRVLFELSVEAGIEENGADFLRSMGLSRASNIWSI